MASIIAQPNQSMLDLIVQSMGSLEGGMVFCAVNNCAISDTPVVGNNYLIPDGSQDSLLVFDVNMVEDGTLNYYAQNGIVAGNLSLTDGDYVTEDGTETYVTEDGTESFASE